MNNNNIDEIYEVDKLNIINCADVSFKREESGFMTVEYKGNTYKKVNLTRLIPFVSKNEYISLTYENDEKEFREIGVIRDIAELEESQRELVHEFLEYKYYMPEITKIYSIKDNMRGFIFVDVETTSGRKTLCVRDWYTNFRMLTKKLLYVVDADGNKYFTPDVEKLDKKSLANVEMFV